MRFFALKLQIMAYFSQIFHKKVIFLCLIFIAFSQIPTFAQFKEKIKKKVDEVNPKKEEEKKEENSSNPKDNPKNGDQEDKDKKDGSKAGNDTSKEGKDASKDGKDNKDASPANNGNTNNNGKDGKAGENGKANPTIDPLQPFDPNSLGKENTLAGGKADAGGGKATKDKKGAVKVDENVRVIDTTAFQERSYNVKKRDEIAYKDGLEKFTPLTHNNSYTKTRVLQKGKTVFGWHPHWAGEAYKSYNFSLLSAVAYYSYQINPATGSYYTIHDWENTGLIPEAHRYKCKVLLSANCFGADNVNKFLGNVEAQSNFVKTIIELVQKRKADGIHLDFEQISAKNRSNFTNFIIDLSSQLKATIKGAWLTMSVPPIDFEGALDMTQLPSHCDLIVINGQEFYGANSDIAGPISLGTGGKNWWNYSLDRSIDEYIAGGVPPAKLLLGVSYYGGEWVTESLKTPSEALKFIKYSTYRDIKKSRGFAPPKEDAEAMSNFHVYRDNNNNYRQIWYDDSLALTKKYDFVNAKKIAGVGIWALGYDNGYPQLWQALASKFAVPEEKPKPAVNPSTIGQFMTKITTIARNPAAALKSGGVIFSLLAIFFGAGIGAYALMYRYGCQWSRAFNLIIKSGVALMIVCVVCLMFLLFKVFSAETALWAMGAFLLGIIVFVLISRSFLIEKDVP